MSKDKLGGISRRDVVKTVAGLPLGTLPWNKVTGEDSTIKIQQHRLSQAVWVLPDDENSRSKWTAEEVVSLTEKLCGHRPQPSTELADPFSVVVGTPNNNRVVKEAATRGLIEMDQLGEDDYHIKQLPLDGKAVLLIAGKNPRSTMFGVFDFFERLGCRFLLSRDVLPETDPELTVPAFDVLGHTECSWRGIWFQYVFATNSMMSLDDYDKMFQQMAKMRMNRVIYYHFPNEPFIDFSYNNERKVVGDIAHPDSGYISYGRNFSGTYRVEDIAVGRDKFGKRERVAPMEFQKVSSSDEALDMGKRFIQQAIKLAKSRGIGTWIGFLPSFVPMNMTKYTRPMPRPHLHWSGLVSCTDPVVTEINRSRVRGIVDAYPDAEGLMLAIPEGHYDDPHADTEELIEREWDNYGEVLRLTMNSAKLRADIAFTEITKNAIRVATEIKPDIRLGISTVCKAPLLTYLDKVLPKDIPFIDIESGSLWGGNPLHLFKQMKGRECAIIPRAIDDGSMAGLQFNLNLYQRDQFLPCARKNGTSGFIIQTTHIRGNEHNFKFLAQGLWNDELTPNQFYHDYARSLFGAEAARLMVQAYDVLEKNEQFLGGRGAKNMPWNQTPDEILVLNRCPEFNLPLHNSPISGTLFRRKDKPYRTAIENMQQADRLFQKALPLCSQAGRRELDYLTDRNMGYIHHFETLLALADVYESWSRALPRGKDDVATTRQKLRETLELARLAQRRAIQSAERFAECVDHPTDLGVLWMINKSTVIGTRLLKQHLGNILAYYEGKQYWKQVEWDLLFDKCPYPSHGVKKSTAGDTGDYEPG